MKHNKKGRKVILIEAVEELQEICEFEPAIKTKGKSEKELESSIKEAAEHLTEDDELSQQTMSILKELDLGVGIAQPQTEDEVEEVEAEEVEDEDEKFLKEANKEAKEAGKEVDKALAKKLTKEKKVNNKQPSFASLMDDVVSKGGSWEKITEVLTKESEDLGLKSKPTIPSVKAHVAYRQKTQESWLSDRGLTITDTGITGKKK